MKQMGKNIKKSIPESKRGNTFMKEKYSQEQSQLEPPSDKGCVADRISDKGASIFRERGSGG